MTRSVENRHAAAAAWVAHGLRNLLAPGQLRLDAWLLQGSDVTLGTAELTRMRTTLQEVVQTMDGLELLRLGPTDRIAKAGTPWFDALRALLSCITSDALFELSGDARDSIPQASRIAVTHLLVDLALAAQGAAPGVQARYCIGINSGVVNVNVTFSRVPASAVDALAHAVRQTADAAAYAPSALEAIAVEMSDTGEVVCRAELPVTDAPAMRQVATHTGGEARTFSVLCIDDNDFLLDALEVRLSQAEGFSHFLRSGSVDEALDQLRQAPVSLVLVDVHLATSHDPMAAISLLRAGSPGARVALFSGSADDGLMQRAMDNGADGFVFKGMASHVLIDAIVRLARGENVWAADVE